MLAASLRLSPRAVDDATVNERFAMQQAVMKAGFNATVDKCLEPQQSIQSS